MRKETVDRDHSAPTTYLYIIDPLPFLARNDP
jgi:hypothetical protein